MDVAQATQQPRAGALAPDVGEVDPLCLTNEGVLDLPAAVDENAHLPPDLARDVGEVARQVRTQNLLRRNAAMEGFFEGLFVTRLETCEITCDVDDAEPPETLGKGAPGTPVNVAHGGHFSNAG